jgi:hypothetical protein
MYKRDKVEQQVKTGNTLFNTLAYGKSQGESPDLLVV